jgi:mRNA interferase YafQ
MSFDLDYTNRFKKEVKICLKRNYNIALLEAVLLELREKGELPLKYKPHLLSGNKDGLWECHIKPDWLITWLFDKTTIVLVRTGTHSDLF